MSTKQGHNQFGQGSKIDKGTKTTLKNSAANDDDFLSGDNQSHPYPYQANPEEGYNKMMSPTRGSNPNIGGNEGEYENTAEDEDRYNYGKSEHDDEIMNRRDNEEIDRHEDESRYSSSTTSNRLEEEY